MSRSEESEATLELAEKLIACPSVTPADAGCTGIVAERLRRIGFRVEYITRGGVTNLWAVRGERRPLFCFAGHIDVVPAGPLADWTSDPFVPTRKGGMLYGRGAADMKSSIAAFVTACEDFVTARPEHLGAIACLLTSDEEGEALHGTLAVCEALAARGQEIDYCVVGEPSSTKELGDTVKNGRRGSLSARLTVIGVQGHVAYPQLARNAVLLALPALGELAATVWDEGDEFFPPTSWQVSNIHAGTGVGNVIPGSVEIDFNFRFAAVSAPEALQARVEAVLKRHGLDYRIAWTLGAKPFKTGGGKLLAVALAAIRDETGITAELSTSGGTSDGRFLAERCAQVIEIGPINATIHKVDEAVAISDLPRLAAIYRRLLEQLLT
jgi:succinyl-diaminopimelate desuccinylase